VLATELVVPHARVAQGDPRPVAVDVLQGRCIQLQDVLAAVARAAHHAILGSGSIVAQLAAERLIDAFQVVVNPVVLGKGRTMFDGLEERAALRLTDSRTFRNVKVLLCYEPG